MKNKTIAFIGGGNMGRAVIAGLIAGGYPPAKLRVADPDIYKLNDLTVQFGIEASASNRPSVLGAEVVVLAVKPQMMRAVAMELAGSIASHTLVISIAAGVRTRALQHWLGSTTPIVRAMPNTPALVRSGATALYAADKVTPEQREVAENILRAVGLTLWVHDESLLDAVTAVSGSGPAYFFRLMEVLEQAAKAQGLAPEQARILVLQTAFGAAKMALESGKDPGVLRAQVTSPGGTTERALRVLDEHGIERMIAEAVTLATLRAAELADQFGEA
ncbi:MAG: pyrroline-5-carboxylate reductase [Gammaproteobacteria bacterium]